MLGLRCKRKRYKKSCSSFWFFHPTQRMGQDCGIVDFSQDQFELFPEKQVEMPQRIDLPNEFKTLTGKINVVDKTPLSYLEKRGIEPCDLLSNKIGYCSEGEFEGRIIIPSFDMDGYVNYFIARSYTVITGCDIRIPTHLGI